MNLKINRIRLIILPILSLILFGASCAEFQQQPTTTDTTNSTQPTPIAQTTPPPPAKQKAIDLPVTLPVLDAMFADENFAAELKSKLSLTDEQIEKLRQTAREATAQLGEGESAESASTAQSTKRATEQIRSILGDDKTTQLVSLVSTRWANGGEEQFAQMEAKPNAVPTDTRIVVNAPAYRMDVFKDGQLVKTYKIGIGYPEFPLPEGMRTAKEIIFNPTWTPPDEPWVKGKLKPFQKVEAGSKLNPLGPVKIPIGLPSLIHGGKQPARLGTFASHGCVGLTNSQVQDFATVLAQISGTQLTSEDVAEYEKNKTETKNVKLGAPMPIELRYETIVVENGTLKIFRDVYEKGTNTEENLRKVLEAYGVSFDSLSPQEKTQILDALGQMAVDAKGEEVTEEEAKRDREAEKNKSKTVTRDIKGKKEIDLQIAALRGKGYPAPVDLNSGSPGAKSGKTAGLTNQANTNANVSPNSNANISTNKSTR